MRLGPWERETKQSKSCGKANLGDGCPLWQGVGDEAPEHCFRLEWLAAPSVHAPIMPNVHLAAADPLLDLARTGCRDATREQEASKQVPGARAAAHEDRVLPEATEHKLQHRTRCREAPGLQEAVVEVAQRLEPLGAVQELEPVVEKHRVEGVLGAAAEPRVVAEQGVVGRDEVAEVNGDLEALLGVWIPQEPGPVGLVGGLGLQQSSNVDTLEARGFVAEDAAGAAEPRFPLGCQDRLQPRMHSKQKRHVDLLVCEVLLQQGAKGVVDLGAQLEGPALADPEVVGSRDLIGHEAERREVVLGRSGERGGHDRFILVEAGAKIFDLWVQLSAFEGGGHRQEQRAEHVHLLCERTVGPLVLAVVERLEELPRLTVRGRGRSESAATGAATGSVSGEVAQGVGGRGAQVSHGIARGSSSSSSRHGAWKQRNTRSRARPQEKEAAKQSSGRKEEAEHGSKGQAEQSTEAEAHTQQGTAVKSRHSRAREANKQTKQSAEERKRHCRARKQEKRHCRAQKQETDTAEHGRKEQIQQSTEAKEQSTAEHGRNE